MSDKPTSLALARSCFVQFLCETTLARGLRWSTKLLEGVVGVVGSGGLACRVVLRARLVRCAAACDAVSAPWRWASILKDTAPFQQAVE